MPPVIYVSGRFHEATEAALALNDAGFVSGATVVDNARTFGGRIFRWRDHLSRFRRDCERCFVPLTLDDNALTHIAQELIDRNSPIRHNGTEREDLHVVTVATPGPPGGPSTLMMSTSPIRIERYRPFFSSGVVLAVAGTQSQNASDLLPPTVKHRSRLHWYIAEQVVAKRHPGAVPVVMNHDVGDTAIGGIAAVATDGTLLLPPTEFVQESISLNVLRELGQPVRIERFSWWSSELSEMLLAGTGFAVAGVRAVHDGERTREFVWPGPAYRRLLAAWSRLVGIDIEASFLQARRS